MRVYWRLLGYLKPYRRRLVLAFACMLLYAVTTAVSIGSVSPFMQVLFERTGQAQVGGTRVAAQADPARTRELAREPLRLESIARWPALVRARVEQSLLRARPLVALERICVFLLVLMLIKNLADYLQSLLVVSIEQSVIRDLRDRLHEHLQKLSLSFYHGRRTGAMVSRLTNDVEFLRTALASSVSTLVKDSLTLAGSLGLAFYASWRLALLAMLVLPLAAFGLGAIGRKMRKRSTATQEKMGELTAVLHESVVGARVVKAFGMEGFEQQKFRAVNHAFFRAYVRMRRIAVAARPVSEMLMASVAIALLWYGGREIFVDQSLAPHQFVLFVTALLTTISPTKSLADASANIQQGVAAAHRVFGILDTEPDLVDRPAARTLAGFRDRVRYDEVEFSYADSAPVLRRVSFEVRRGEVVALVGASGAGKSTALDLLARFYDVDQGRITVDGVDLRDYTVASLRSQLAIVTQETILFHDTVRNNIAYGRPGATDEEIRGAAVAAHAHAFVQRMPQGYDTVIGERGLKLSGGERQRLAIARAVLKNAPILLLDEATSSLDVESERMVQDALERLMRDRTVLVIAHRLSTVQHADRIVVLDRGEVVASGTHAELMDRDGVYRRLYQLQFVASDGA